MTPPTRQPRRIEKQGLYDPAHEHDACGVGFVANIRGEKSHEVVSKGIRVLVNLEHRGACGCDPETGDGAGLLVHARFDDTTSPDTLTKQFAIRGSSGWGVGAWGTMLWGATGRQSSRKRLARSFFSVQVELSNRFPDEPVEIVEFGITADGMKGRWAHV